MQKAICSINRPTLKMNPIQEDGPDFRKSLNKNKNIENIDVESPVISRFFKEQSTKRIENARAKAGVLHLA